MIVALFPFISFKSDNEECCEFGSLPAPSDCTCRLGRFGSAIGKLSSILAVSIFAGLGSMDEPSSNNDKGRTHCAFKSSVWDANVSDAGKDP